MDEDFCFVTIDHIIIVLHSHMRNKWNGESSAGDLT